MYPNNNQNPYYGTNSYAVPFTPYNNGYPATNYSQNYAYYPRQDVAYYTSPTLTSNSFIPLKDYGPRPLIINIDEATTQNNNYRTVLWTGNHLQLTLMSLNVGEDIGLEMHPNLDQFIRIEEGQALVMMGDSANNLTLQNYVDKDYAFIIPAGYWHNLINTGATPLKVYSIYAPTQHPFGTVHQTKADAQAAE